MSDGLLNLQALSKSKGPLEKTPMSTWLSSGNMASVPTEEEMADEITRKILAVPLFQGKAKEAKEVKFPSAADFHSGSYMVKIERMEKLIHGLSDCLKIRGNVHYQVHLYMGCLERAIVAVKGALERQGPPTASYSHVSVPASQQGRKRPPSSPPGISGMRKSSTGSIPPTQAEVDENNNNNDQSERNAESDFIQVKSRGVLRREKKTHGQPTTRPGQNQQETQPRRHKARPDAIVVKVTNGETASYADILRKLYAEPSLQDTVGKKVESIRHSASGALVLRLSKGAHDVSALTTELGDVLGDATASALRRTTSIEVRDLDESNTAEEVRRALGTQLSSPGLKSDVVKSLRKAYAGTLTAVVALPDDLAAQAIKLGHLRVGWPELPTSKRDLPGPPTMRFLQLNLNHCETAQDLLRQTVRNRRIDVAIVCDQYRNLDPPYTWLADTNKQAAIWVLRGAIVQERPARARKYYTWACINDIYVFSVYAPPRLTDEEFSALLANITEEAQGKRPLVLAGDFNAWSMEWGCSETRARGTALMDSLAPLDVVLLNTGNTPTFVGPNGQSIIDVTFVSDTLAPRTTSWQVSKLYTHSDHQALLFGIRDARPPGPAPHRSCRWNSRSLNETSFTTMMAGAEITQRSTEEMAAELMSAITGACDASVARATGRGRHGPVYWWTDGISDLRRACMRARRLAQRARGRPNEDARRAEFTTARHQLRATIRASKRQCWSRLCEEVDHDAWGRPYET
ncbi:unnamed protein product, partial [Trichogramma brassicae]